MTKNGFLLTEKDQGVTVEEIIKIANPSNIGDSITSLAQEKETVTVIFSFYMHYGRLESTDPTANWRLDIWQDVVFDIFKEGRYLTGYGYNEIFPQMLDPTAPGRLGRDGMNEHVHNYFVNIFAIIFFIINSRQPWENIDKYFPLYFTRVMYP